MIHADTELRLQGVMPEWAATKQATRKVFHIEKGNLIEHLQEVFVILVDSEGSGVCCMETLFEQCLHTQLVIELFEQKQTTV